MSLVIARPFLPQERPGFLLKVLMDHQIWAIDRDYLPRLEMAFRHAPRDVSLPVRDQNLTKLRAAVGRDGRDTGQFIQTGNVALIPVFGPLDYRASWLTAFLGGTGLDVLASQFTAALAAPSVSQILLVIDSPGGSVYGVEELASRIARASKPVTAIADPLSASAAYWIGAAARKLVVTPSGQVGSIGVLAAHIDVSKADEKAGLKTTIVTSTPYKAEFAPEFPLSDEARAEMQDKVNSYHRAFVTAVAKARRVPEGRVEADFGRGRMVLARDAVSRGMADRVATLSEVLAEMTRKPATVGRPSADAIAARLRVLELDAIADREARIKAIRDRAAEVQRGE